MKKRKPDSNSKSSAEVPEVLVLPPRTLLDKFGISFGDIDKFLDIQKSCNKDAPLHHAPEKCEKSDTSDTEFVSSYIDLNESSIMKTANLMKKSLFLSPTFTNSHLVDSSVCEVLPSSASSVVGINIFDTGNDKGGQELIPQNDSEILSERSTTKEQIHEKLYKNKKDQSEIDMKTISIIDNTKHRNSVSKKIDTENSKDLNILKSSSNSNSPVPINSITLIHNKSMPVTEDIAEIECIKINCSSEKEVKNIERTKHEQINTKLEGNESPNISMKLNTESRLKKLDNQVMDESIPNEVIIENKKELIKCTEIHILPSQKFDILQTGKKSSKTDDIKCHFHQNTNISDSIITADVNEYLQNKKRVVDNRRALQCKSDIQGVEKPGGDKEFELLYLNREENPKKYRIKETLKASKENKSPHFFEIVTADCNIDVVDSSKVNIVNNFCICSDFGSFDYYSLEYYEHIHFWKHKNIKCSSNVIFSIYCDDNNCLDSNNSFETVENDESESEYICINNNEIEYEILSDVSEESHRRTLEPTLVDMEVPMIYKSQPAKKKQAKTRNTTEANSLYEVVNVASNELEMQTKADNSKRQIPPQKQRNKRKLKRDRNEDSPRNKKARVDSKISEEFAASVDITNANDELCGLSEITVEGHSKTERSDVTCAICHQGVLESKWCEHIARKHNYLAWREGDASLDVTNGETVKEHLTKMLLKFGVLVCSTCGVERSEASKYLSHINSCERLPGSLVSQIAEGPEVRVKCSACQVEVSDWYDHIGSAHNYLAYKEGDSPVDFENDAAVRRHLSAISKEYNGLICSKCGCRHQFVKPYLKHVQKCVLEECCDNSVSSVKCGVCNEEVIQDAWTQHIEREHDYLAWESGEAPLDVNDPEAVNRHLYKILKQIDGLVCTKCGCRRKYVKSYLTHISQCTAETGYTPPKRKFATIRRRMESPNNSVDNAMTCGVCGLVKEELEWLDHIEKEHNYLAWKFGEPPIDLNNTRAMAFHLNTISKNFANGFLCTKCGIRQKLVRAFLKHIQTCKGDLPNNDSVLNDSNLDSSITNSLIENSDNVTCGVCKKSMEEQFWMKHIEEEHFYLAWKETDKELDLEDSSALRDYLYSIVQKQGHLTCKKCGRTRKYAKSFLAHLTECDTNVNSSLETTDTSFQVEDTEPTAIIKCGVCQKEMEYRKWEVHLRVHEYIAWKEGETPLDSSDEQAINAHLYDMSKMYKGLTCGKCNTTKKYVKAYRGHVAYCDFNLDVEAVTENLENRDTYECAICHEKGAVNKFKSHAMDVHYNVAWMVGDIPIDVRNVSVVEKYLKEYQKSNGTLKCRQCGSARASLAGFFAHVVQCGLSEESMDMYKSVCDICNAKYLGVYKHAHMAIHRTEEAKRRLADKKPEADDTPDASGKRRAAQKAKNVIKNITEVTKDTETDAEDEGDFNCPEDSTSSESDDSAETEIEEVESVHGTDVDSDLSDTETRVRYRKLAVSTFTTSNRKRIPFNIQDPDVYIAKTFKDFTKMHLSSTTLFPEWLNCEYEPVPDTELPQYMPPLKESCQVKSGSKTTTYKLFEAKCDKELSLFVGASIQSISWAPSCGKQAYLAVNCHKGTDAPRVNAKEILQHPGLIQIWDFKDLQHSPSFVFGLAHDLGTVWGMDWCPSGACEVLPHVIPETFVRLGLLAVACSNGIVCIFSVPYPPTVTEKDKLVFKLKPVAELRLFRDPNKKVQATAISWSMQKGHACIAVGYGNGMTAKYDLVSDSPLLTCVEDGVKIFYPFHDERPHTACITDVKTFAFGPDLCGDASTSPCGVAATLGGGRVHVPLTAERLLPEPHWPAVLLAGNTDIITQAINEVDWWGHGRRLGSMNSGCGCLFCGRVAAFFPPLLKTMALHPAYNDDRDSQVKAKIDIMSLQSADNSKPNNTHSLEPRSYEEMVELYGIQFNLGPELKRKDINRNMNKPKPRNAERYPLADITSMAFCPIAKHHTRLAIATFGGIIFVINT